MEHKVIFLNGPPSCGKDQAASFLMKHLNARHKKLATRLKETVHQLLGIPYSCEEAERKFGKEWKDTPQGRCYGHKPRDLYIWMSEQCVKPQFGVDMFGRLLLGDMVKPTSTDFTVISDCGFAEECVPIINFYKPQNCLIVRLHREGCTFEGDSRSYIELPGVTTLDLQNRYDLMMFEIQIVKHVKDWVGME
jgi:hypothetical protein